MSHHYAPSYGSLFNLVNLSLFWPYLLNVLRLNTLYSDLIQFSNTSENSTGRDRNSNLWPLDRLVEGMCLNQLDYAQVGRFSLSVLCICVYIYKQPLISNYVLGTKGLCVNLQHLTSQGPTNQAKKTVVNAAKYSLVNLDCGSNVLICILSTYNLLGHIIGRGVGV